MNARLIALTTVLALIALPAVAQQATAPTGPQISESSIPQGRHIGDYEKDQANMKKVEQCLPPRKVVLGPYVEMPGGVWRHKNLCQ